MKQQYFTAGVPAVLAAMGVILSWTNLRFPGTVPSGFKLFLLSLLIFFRLMQIGVEKFSSHPLAACRLNLFSAGIAAAFYGLSAVESFRLYRVYHRPADDWLMLAVSMLIAFTVTAACVMTPAVSKDETR